MSPKTLRPLSAAAIVLAVALAGSACGDDKVKWNCTCSAICDGDQSSVTDTACGTESEASAAVDDAVAECEAELDADCEALECACECTATDEGC
jgi:hypothetical protein